MHEHIFIDFKAPPAMVPPVTGISVLRPPGASTDSGLRAGLTDYDESLAEVMEFKKVGGATIVDVTNFGLTRDPDALVRIARASGLNVVMGAGWYQKALHPPDMSDRTVDELTEIVVRDVVTGAQDTRVRSGIVGEVGVQGHPLVANEIKSVRASARAARLTCAPMTIHSFGSDEETLTVLDIIASEGVAMSRVVMGHMGSRDMAYVKRLYDRGVYVEFDYLGQAPLPPGTDAAAGRSRRRRPRHGRRGSSPARARHLHQATAEKERRRRVCLHFDDAGAGAESPRSRRRRDPQDPRRRPARRADVRRAASVLAAASH
jgi:phosphotriesterase-related protein